MTPLLPFLLPFHPQLSRRSQGNQCRPSNVGSFISQPGHSPSLRVRCSLALSIIDLILSPSLPPFGPNTCSSLAAFSLTTAFFFAVTLEQILARFFASLPCRCRVGISSCLPGRASCVFMSCSPPSLSLFSRWENIIGIRGREGSYKEGPRFILGR